MHYKPGTGYVESDGRKVMSKRQHTLHLARIAGYQNDSSTFTTLLCERRGVSWEAMHEAWHKGVAQRGQQTQTA